MEVSKVIFLDIDGPIFPARAYALKENRQRSTFPRFDPVAVALVSRLCEVSGAKIVMTSTWKGRGYEYICDAFRRNDFGPDLLHEDWATLGTSGNDRPAQIRAWLRDHPEVTHFVCIDDMRLDMENAVLVDFDEGFLLHHYRAAAELLGSPDSFVVLG